MSNPYPAEYRERAFEGCKMSTPRLSTVAPGLVEYLVASDPSNLGSS
jgi:hypothetical protein